MAREGRRFSRILRRVLVVAALGYAGGALLFAVAYRFFLFPAPTLTSAPDVPGVALLRFTARGKDRAALFVEAAKPDRVTIVHFHGNGETIFDETEVARAFTAHGVGFCAAEYPGYGLLTGESPSEEAFYDAAEDVLEHLYTKGVPRDRVVLMGFSMGTGVAAEMARRGHGRRLLLFAPYTSITDMLRRFAPFLPVTLLARDKFDTFGKVNAIGQDVLVVHGKRDRVIPFSMGERLAAAWPRATFVPVPNADHNDLFFSGGDALIAQAVAFAER